MSLLVNTAQRYNRPKRNLAIIAAGNQRSLAIDKNGNAWGWGGNGTALGDNTNVLKYTPVRVAMNGLNKTFCSIDVVPANSAGITQIAAALDYKGQAWGWGGALNGDGTNISKCYPVAVGGTKKTFCKVSVGLGNGVLIDKYGRVWCWGQGNSGQLGDNTLVSKLTPVSVLGAVKTFCEISASSGSVLALDKNGRAWAWGTNTAGKLGDNSTTSRLTPVSVAGAVKTFCKIEGGGTSLAIDKNGRAWAWGDGASGQLGDNTTVSKLTPVSVLGAVKTFCEISVGNAYSLAIDKNGRAWAWGLNTYGNLGDNSTTSRLTPVSVLGAVKTFCEISGGNGYSLAIDKNGRAWAWGINTNNERGSGSFQIFSPVSVLGTVKTFCQITCGQLFSLAIDKNGRAWAWSANTNGQLGDNTTTSKLTPVSVLGAVKTFCQITGGTNHTLAIDKNGRAWAWGLNTSGQLGDNTIVSKLTPVSVLGAVKTFCQISGGDLHSLAIDKNGRAWAWGSNTAGQLGDNSTVSKLTPVSVRGAVKTFCQITGNTTYSLALDKNGRAWAWGANTNGNLGDTSTTRRLTPVSVAGAVKTFCQISAGIPLAAIGSTHSLAIDKNGRAWAWGANTNGQLGNGAIACVYTPISITGALKTFCKISTGDGFSLAIDKNGRAWAWGSNAGGNLGDNSVTSRASPVSVLGTVRTFCKITAGGVASSTTFSLAIDKNGRLWTWGYNGVGQLGNNTVVSQRTPVSVAGAVKTFCEISNGCNQAFSLAIDKNGRAWAWGINGNGQLGDGTTTSRLTPVSVAGTVRTFCKVSVGGFHSLAIDKNGRLWAWGNNSNGQLGNNATGTSVCSPVCVCGAIKTFCHIAGGNSQSIAIDKYGQAWGWGFNGSGQTGDGSATDRRTPVSVEGQKKTFCKIASGNGVSLAIDNYGRLWGWGFNGNSQVGNNSSAAMRTPTRVCTNRTFCEITAGNTHVTAVEKNGRVWVWGTNATGQLANPIAATGVSALTPVSVAGAIKTFCKIAAGATASLALDKNGKGWGWGLNSDGRLGVARVNWDRFIGNGTSSNFWVNSPTEIYGNKTFCTIAFRANTGYAVDYRGRAWAWGSNQDSLIGNDFNSGNALTPVRVCVI